MSERVVVLGLASVIIIVVSQIVILHFCGIFILPDNREQAEKRLYSLEKSLLKRPEVAQCYKEAMNTNVVSRAMFES